MLIQSETRQRDALKTLQIDCDLAVIGGGLAGVCAAITAARAGLPVTLVQDRSVLGGNASSEVRLWGLGATSHMGNNNRWSREGGVIDEILVENLYRNPEGNPVIFDTVVLDKVVNEPQIQLLLNTVAYDLEKSDPQTVAAVWAFCSQNSTRYVIRAPLYCDASGDGIVAFLAGAAFRMGAETKEEFGEKFAPDETYGSLLGHSLYFYSRDTGKPVKYVPPDYALADISKVPRYRQFNSKDHGCQLWWIEYGGRLDTVHDTEKIKWELWKVVYGVWNYIKNSGKFPEADTLTLEWVGMIPGKRESRRFEGDYLLVQQDIVEQRRHADTVSFGGWAIDLHPADGVYSDKPGCNQWHSQGVYPIPYRCLYSRNIRNLYLAGRISSMSHVAFGSTRVMLTGAHSAQAIGMAAVLCRRHNLQPRDLAQPERMRKLQQELIKRGQYLPGLKLEDSDDLALQADIRASSQFCLSHLSQDGPWLPLTDSWAMMLPMRKGKMARFCFKVIAKEQTDLVCELRISSRTGNYTPNVTLQTRTLSLSPAASREAAGKEQAQRVDIDFDTVMDQDQYAFVCLIANPNVTVRCSQTRVTGVLALWAKENRRVSNSKLQKPDKDIGVDTFEFWIPQRWPEGSLLALSLDPPLNGFGPENLTNGIARPYIGPNAWVADLQDEQPRLTLSWNTPQKIGRIELCFDTDSDHALETVLMGHPFNVVPYCVRQYRLLDGKDRIVYECSDNHQTRNTVVLEKPVTTDKLQVELRAPNACIPAALFEIRCYPQ